MKIEKFSHVDNGKVVYAVIGAINPTEAMEEVCRYKKANSTRFFEEHICYTGLIKNKNLYRIEIDVNDTFDKGLTPCYIIARDTIDIDKYMQVA